LQWTGERKDVGAFLTVFQRRARSASVTLDTGETKCDARYVFAGISLDQAQHTVALSPKAHGHLLPHRHHEHTTVRRLEHLLGRLWFAARILALPTHRYWLLLKAPRRIMARLDRGLIGLHNPALLPRSAEEELHRW
jgi:hypothetical protein